MQNAKGWITSTELNLSSLQNLYLCDKPYWEAIDSLLYISVSTRSDIAFAVAKPANCVERPTMRHLNCVDINFALLDTEP